MNIIEAPKTINYGKRDDDFKNLILKILKMGDLKQKYLDILMNDKNMQLYSNAFTSANVDPINNYEFYEILGDATLGNFLIYYCSRRFPNLSNAKGVSVLSKLKATYGQKEFLAKLALKLSFTDFITCTDEEKLRLRNSLLEDCFEAFIGVTVYILDLEIMNGVGFAIAYDILKEIYDTEYIDPNFETLQDPITKLKEFFDKSKKIGDIEYKEKPLSDPNDRQRLVEATVYFIFKDNRPSMLLGIGNGSIKKKAQAKAAADALAKLAAKGFTKDNIFVS